MTEQTLPIQRLEQWLKRVELPDLAKTCIENYVLSCDSIDSPQLFNFINIDIKDFGQNTQGKLLTGLFYAYTGVGCFEYVCFGRMFYRVCLN